MNYELAKKLKDAGFPMRGGGGDTSREQFRGNDGEVYHIPTLSELIEACGNRLLRLDHGVGTPESGGSWWQATDYPYTSIYKGLIPEEAVANLWLALNKK